jgi:short-subunit dehydrogenase
MINIEGKYALVTGASSGIGRNISKILAGKGCNLVIVARREEKLKGLRKEILEEYEKINVVVISLDLSFRESPEILYNKIKKSGKNIDILINNAGYGIHDYFIDIPWENEEAMLNLLIMNLTHLTKLFVKDMVERNFGFILQVSSIGAFQPTPSYATYAAAKGFVFNFGLALNYELRETPVRCCVLCPGVTATGFQEAAGHTNKTLFSTLTKMDSKKVAESGVKAMLKGKDFVVPGLMNSINSKMMSVFPKRLATKIAFWAMGSPE